MDVSDISKWPFVMDEELNQCLNSIPDFVAQLEGQRHSVDLNLIERLIMIIL